MSGGHRHHRKRCEQWKTDHRTKCGGQQFGPKRSRRYPVLFSGFKECHCRQKASIVVPPQNDLFRNFFPDVAKIPRRPESGRFWYLSLIYKAF
jgi:hypothetical protein